MTRGSACAQGFYAFQRHTVLSGGIFRSGLFSCQQFVAAYAQRAGPVSYTHLGEITPADLARAALFSPWYAYRLFRRHTGLTPADYIRRLRLSRSALRLRDEGCRITDVAFELGFGSVDG